MVGDKSCLLAVKKERSFILQHVITTGTGSDNSIPWGSNPSKGFNDLVELLRAPFYITVGHHGHTAARLFMNQHIDPIPFHDLNEGLTDLRVIVIAEATRIVDYFFSHGALPYPTFVMSDDGRSASGPFDEYPLLPV